MNAPSFPKVRTGIGQSSHRFLSADHNKPCVIAGVTFENVPGLASDSDGDVVFQAVCNAITSVTGVLIIGGVAAELCHKHGITDSQVYLEKAFETLGRQKIQHIALTIEGKRPLFQSRCEEMRFRTAQAAKLRIENVGMTFISGDGLTDFGCGDGVQCLCVITTVEY